MRDLWNGNKAGDGKGVPCSRSRYCIVDAIRSFLLLIFIIPFVSCFNVWDENVRCIGDRGGVLAMAPGSLGQY